ncbi:MAG TPA: hypothetical protein VFT52_01370 [Luteimonas sp.]|jgi:hypothetical protein|nr:hypothetical protein [Luteimonas sp.]
MERMSSADRNLATLLAGCLLLAAGPAPAAGPLPPARCDPKVAQSGDDRACEWRKAWGDVALMAGTPYFEYDAGAPRHGADFVFGYEWVVPGVSLRSYWGRAGGMRHYNGRLELDPRGGIRMEDELGVVLGTGRVDPDGATALTQDGNTNRILMQPDGSIANTWERGQGDDMGTGTVHYYPATRKGRALAEQKAGGD